MIKNSFIPSYPYRSLSHHFSTTPLLPVLNPTCLIAHLPALTILPPHPVLINRASPAVLISSYQFAPALTVRSLPGLIDQCLAITFLPNHLSPEHNNPAKYYDIVTNPNSPSTPAPQHHFGSNRVLPILPYEALRINPHHSLLPVQTAHHSNGPDST